MNAPCKNCILSGCGEFHGKCKEYALFLKEVNVANKKRRLYTQVGDFKEYYTTNYQHYHRMRSK